MQMGGPEATKGCRRPLAQHYPHTSFGKQTFVLQKHVCGTCFWRRSFFLACFEGKVVAKVAVWSYILGGKIKSNHRRPKSGSTTQTTPSELLIFYGQQCKWRRHFRKSNNETSIIIAKPEKLLYVGHILWLWPRTYNIYFATFK